MGCGGKGNQTWEIDRSDALFAELMAWKFGMEYVLVADLKHGKSHSGKYWDRTRNWHAVTREEQNDYNSAYTNFRYEAVLPLTSQHERGIESGGSEADYFRYSGSDGSYEFLQKAYAEAALQSEAMNLLANMNAGRSIGGSAYHGNSFASANSGVASSRVGDGTVINHETQAYANLTDAERALVKRHPGPAASVHYNMGQAFEVTQQMFPNVRNAHNNAADAFRHAYFNALNARSIGSDLAYQFGVAHEAWVGNPALERAMDITNNVFGINAEARNPCMSNAALANYIYNAVSNWQLIMIQNGRLMPTSIP